MVSTINQETIKDLNLNVSLASADVQLVKQIPITDVNDVFCCLLLSNVAKKLYNSALYLFKKQYKENQTTLTYETLDKLMKNEELYPNFARLYQDLPAKVSQQVLKLFSQNINSFFALKQSEKLTDEQKKKVNLPRYYSKNGLVPIYYTNQALSKTAFEEDGVLHFSKTDLKIKLDLATLPEISHFGQINQVRIVPTTKNKKNKKLSDLLEEYCSGNNDQTTPLFTLEIVYTAPLTLQRSQNQSLNLRYETKIIKKVSKRTQKPYEIKKVELVEVNYTEEFLQSVAGIDQNLNQLAVGVVTPEETTAFNYDIKYLKSVNQHWNKEKAKLQEEISKQEKLLEELKDDKIISSQSDNVKKIEEDLKDLKDLKDKKVLIKQLKNQIKRITTRRNRKIDNYTHQLSRKLINHLSELGVKNIIYGKNVNFKQEINLGKVNNQNFVNIPFNQIIDRLKYKALLAGINFMTVEESYTSKTSFLDKEKLYCYKGQGNKAPKDYTFLGSRFTRSLFRSKDGHVIHADINASFNIIRKVSGDDIYNFVNIGSIKVSSPKRWKINLQ